MKVILFLSNTKNKTFKTNKIKTEMSRIRTEHKMLMSSVSELQMAKASGIEQLKKEKEKCFYLTIIPLTYLLALDSQLEKKIKEIEEKGATSSEFNILIPKANSTQPVFLFCFEGN